MADYITVDQLRAYIGSDTTNFSDVLATLCTVASRSVEAICERVFFADSTATAQYYTPVDYVTCETDDFWTTTGLVVATDDGLDGTYSTSWTLDTDYYCNPINQIQGGITGWPYTELKALVTRAFTRSTSVYRRPPVKVTAKWGWAAVPDEVVLATKISAARLFKLKDAPDGFVGLDGWGPVRMRENPEIRALLGPFMKNPVVVG